MKMKILKMLATCLIVILLFLAWFLFFLGTEATTCTMCDTDSMATGMILSTPIYLVICILILFVEREKYHKFVLFIMCPSLFHQIYIACLFIYAVNIRSGCGCWAYHDYPMDVGMPPSERDLFVGPVLLATAVATFYLALWRWHISNTLKSVDA